LIDPWPERSSSTIDPAPQELPTIDGRRTGLPYRYAYGLGLPKEFSETLVGIKRRSSMILSAVRHVHAFAGRIAGEFVRAAPRPRILRLGSSLMPMAAALR
jgi:carotenoid cleavage dioxygenase